MLSSDYGYNPPLPERREETFEAGELSEKKKKGQRLLTLVRVLEKSSNSKADGFESDMEECVELFNTLIALYSRRGLLQGDNLKADRIISTTKSSTREKGQRKGSSRGENRLSLDGGNISSEINNDSSNYQQESLVLTAIVRVLNGTYMEGNDFKINQDQALLIALASELCVAISQHILNAAKGFDNCSQAEFELLMQSGKSIISGLVNSLKKLEQDLKKNPVSCLTMAIPDQAKHIEPITSCLRAASSLIILFGTKLSRSVAMLSDLKKLAWSFLTVNDDSIQLSAAKLIAIIPLAGGIDRKTPSNIWNETMNDVISMLSTVMCAMAPLNKFDSRALLSEEANSRSQDWIQFVREEMSQEIPRIFTFHRFLRALTLSFKALLSQDGRIANIDSSLSGAKIDIDSILSVVENFVSFPLAAETVFYKTKKRLRNEAVDNGLLSPRAVSTQIGNQVKRLGHDILDCILETLGASTLLPYASSITRISYASLVTSCSSPLRKVLDPSSAMQMDGKRKRWLHGSVPMRTIAIETLKKVLTLFGNYKTAKMASSAASKSSGEKAIALVAGCFIEEMGRFNAMNEADDSWGTYYERCILMVSALKCLQATLGSWGGFLCIQIRSMIDSLVVSGLEEMDEWNTLISSSSVQIELFGLASCCVTTPWNDGSSSSILYSLAKAAKKYEKDMDASVSMAAKAALRVCDLAAVPRAPALLYVSRAISKDSNLALQPDLSAIDLINNIQNAQKDISAAEKAHIHKSNEKKRKTKSEESLHRGKEKKQVKTSKPKVSVFQRASNEDNVMEQINGADEEKVSTVTKQNMKEERVEAISTLNVAEKADPIQEQDKEKQMSTKDDDSSVAGTEDEEKEQIVPMDEDESEIEDAFPEIMGDGGPDSDDE